MIPKDKAKVNLMKVEVISQKRNELLNRTEITFRVDHEGGGTPSRLEIRQKLTDMLGAEQEKVYLTKFTTKTGSMTATGVVNIYDSVDKAKYAESEHIIKRNTPKTEKKE